MMILTLVGLAHVAYSATMWDQFNMYYCPDDSYCLGKQKQPRGMAGPATMFVECKNSEGSVQETVWNYYNDDPVGIYDSVYVGDWTYNGAEMLGTTGQPPATHGGKTFANKCCRGYNTDQCEITGVVIEEDTTMGCCYNMGYGAMMKPCCHTAHKVQPDNAMLGASRCPLEDRRGGGTMFEEGVTCEEFEAAGWGVEREGCCYNKGYGAMMKPCCQSAHEYQPSNAMLGEAQCPVGDRMGGGTSFEEGVTCEEFEADNWGEEPEERQGCCYNKGYGAMMMPCCQMAHEMQPANAMLGESQCPVESRMGGETLFEEGLTCEDFEAANWGEERYGCCFNMGYGSMMMPCCQGAHESQPTNDMLGESECPVAERMGGATMFEEGVTCEQHEAAGWGMEPEEEMGCCYNMGFGSMMKPCCQNAHDMQPANDMLGKSQCPEEGRMGGATKFEEGVTCEQFEALGWEKPPECVDNSDFSDEQGNMCSDWAGYNCNDREAAVDTWGYTEDGWRAVRRNCCQTCSEYVVTPAPVLQPAVDCASITRRKNCKKHDSEQCTWSKHPGSCHHTDEFLTVPITNIAQFNDYCAAEGGAGKMACKPLGCKFKNGVCGAPRKAKCNKIKHAITCSMIGNCKLAAGSGRCKGDELF